MSSGREATFIRLRRGHVLVVIAVFGASLIPVTCVERLEATGPPPPNGPPAPTYPVYFLHHDHLGSAVMLTCYKRPAAENCADGAVKRYFRYDAYGLLRAFDAAGTQLDHNDLGALLVDRLYTGQRWEPQARVYDYNARFYEPTTARFVSHDPAREFANPYAYVGWRPVRLIDPSGAFSMVTFNMIFENDPALAASYAQMTGGVAQGGGATGVNGGAGGFTAKGDAPGSFSAKMAAALGSPAQSGSSDGSGAGAPSSAETDSSIDGEQFAQLDGGMMPGMDPLPQPSLYDSTVPNADMDAGEAANSALGVSSTTAAGAAMGTTGTIMTGVGLAKFAHAGHDITMAMQTGGLAAGGVGAVAILADGVVLTATGVVMVFGGGMLVGAGINDFVVAPYTGGPTYFSGPAWGDSDR